MIDVGKALGLIEQYLLDCGTEELPLDHCAGKILMEDVRADREYPPFDRVMMDGIAIRYESLMEGIRSFRIKGVAPAGSPPLTLGASDECLEVMTGAMLPNGSNLVIPYEEVSIQNKLASVDPAKNYQKFQSVHLQGSDTSKGDLLLEKGGQTSRSPIRHMRFSGGR